jgi:hypothetical protein
MRCSQARIQYSLSADSALTVGIGSFYDSPMGNRHPGSSCVLVKDSSQLAEIAKEEQIRVTFARCNHSQLKYLDPRALIEHMGKAVTIRDLRKRLRCTRCSSRRVEFETTTIGRLKIERPVRSPRAVARNALWLTTRPIAVPLTGSAST